MKKPSLCQLTEKVISLQQNVERLRELIAQRSNRQTEQNLNQVINSLREADSFSLKSRKVNDHS